MALQVFSLVVQEPAKHQCVLSLLQFSTSLCKKLQAQLDSVRWNTGCCNLVKKRGWRTFRRLSPSWTTETTEAFALSASLTKVVGSATGGISASWARNPVTPRAHLSSLSQTMLQPRQLRSTSTKCKRTSQLFKTLTCSTQQIQQIRNKLWINTYGTALTRLSALKRNSVITTMVSGQGNSKKQQPACQCYKISWHKQT